MTAERIAGLLTKEQIAGLLCSAFEGGSNYWYEIINFTDPREFKFRFDPEHVYSHIDNPLNEGGSLRITANGDSEKGEINGQTEFLLDLAAIEKGVRSFFEKNPHSFADVLTGDDDAITGDIFLQHCLFGDVIYG